MGRGPLARAFGISTTTDVRPATHPVITTPIIAARASGQCGKAKDRFPDGTLETRWPAGLRVPSPWHGRLARDWTRGITGETPVPR